VVSNISYMDQLISLTKMVSQANPWEDEQILFEQVDDFLLDSFELLSHGVFTNGLNHQGHPCRNKIRSVWNKDMMSYVVGFDTLYEMVTTVLKKKNGLDKMHRIRIGELYFCLFYYGMQDGQMVWGYIVNDEKIQAADKIFEFLHKYLKNSFNCVGEIKKIKSQSALAFIDDITGFYNHRKLLEDINYLIDKNKLIGEGFCLLFIDIDHFKDVNDNFGHLVGTKLLSDMAKRIASMVRDHDLLYRYGGDEFVVILTNTKYINVKEIATRILDGVKNQKFKLDVDNDYPLSISIGISRFPEDSSSSKEIICLADRMMYAAKKQGRGKVCLVSEKC